MQKTQESRVRSLGQEDTREEETAAHSSILSGKSHGQRSLAGYSPQSHKESDTTEGLSTHTKQLYSNNDDEKNSCSPDYTLLEETDNMQGEFKKLVLMLKSEAYPSGTKAGAGVSVRGCTQGRLTF